MPLTTRSQNESFVSWLRMVYYISPSFEKTTTNLLTRMYCKYADTSPVYGYPATSYDWWHWNRLPFLNPFSSTKSWKPSVSLLTTPAPGICPFLSSHIHVSERKWVFSLCSTGISSHLGAKLRDWADRQAEAGCYSWAALSSNDSNTRYTGQVFGHI